MKRTFFLIVIALLFIEGIGNELLAQPKKGLIGIAINLTKGFLVSQDISTPQAPFTLGFIYLPSDKLHLEGDIGLRVQKDTSGSTSSEFVFGSNIWYVIQNYEELSTFARKIKSLKPKNTWAYFNNDSNAYAPWNALDFRKLLEL